MSQEANSVHILQHLAHPESIISRVIFQQNSSKGYWCTLVFSENDALTWRNWRSGTRVLANLVRGCTVCLHCCPGSKNSLYHRAGLGGSCNGGGRRSKVCVQRQLNSSLPFLLPSLLAVFLNYSPCTTEHIL